MWPLSSCHSASSHTISLQSENRSMSYVHKSDFEDGGRRHLEFQKFQFLVTWLRSGSPFAVVYRISSKSDDFSLRYGNLTNFFLNGGRPPSWILKICSFCHVAVVDMPCCMLIQNFTEIGQLVDKLWPKKRFSWDWQPTMVWTLYKMVYLVSSDVVLEAIVGLHQIFCQNPIIFSLRYIDLGLTIFKMVSL